MNRAKRARTSGPQQDTKVGIVKIKSEVLDPTRNEERLHNGGDSAPIDEQNNVHPNQTRVNELTLEECVVAIYNFKVEMQTLANNFQHLGAFYLHIEGQDIAALGDPIVSICFSFYLYGIH